MRKTKIICTLGPATDDPKVVKKLIDSGMNVARFNFSHGNHEEQEARLNILKDFRHKMNMPVAALMDTKGPEIRLGDFENGSAELLTGKKFTLTTTQCVGNAERSYVNYPKLPYDVKKGNRILLDDGKIGLTVKNVTSTDIECIVQNDGIISNHKGVNVPGVALSMPYISKKDYDDILFAIKQEFDFIAASFIRTADDVKEIRMLLKWNGGENIKIISKIENMQGVKNFDEILEVSDAIMIARGDMGVELPLEDVPSIQKKLIKKVYESGKPVITATQMLDSMITNPRPTRAEATDVANAIYDGTSAIMLSGETAAGKYPVEALQTMVRIANRTEDDIDYRKRLKQRNFTSGGNVTYAISHAACTSAMDLGASAIVAFTLSGRTARDISALRPSCRIIACTSSPLTYRQLSLSWGVTPLITGNGRNLEDLFEGGLRSVVKSGLLKTGDMVVLTAGVPIGVSGSTNFIKVTQA